MKMTISDENDSLKRIDVNTKTKNIFNKIFAIDNHYQTLYQKSNHTCYYHKKIIKQPNVEQQLEINYSPEIITYSNDSSRVSIGSTYDFFSMLMYLRAVPMESLLQKSIIVDMEGEFFRATFEKVKEQSIKVGKTKILTDKIKIIYTKLDKNQHSVLDYTDIFFWKIASESGDKYIWIEKNDKRKIIKAKFSENKTSLEAKLVEE